MLYYRAMTGRADALRSWLMNWRATDFEFRNRFWLIGGIFGLGFLGYAVDAVNAAEALARLILQQATGDSAELERMIRMILAAGAALALVAALVRSWATAYLHGAVVHDAVIHSDRLVADGPYRHVRNPLYLGTMLLGLGMGPLASRTGYAVIVIGITAFSLRLINREEAELRQSQGDGYRRYCAAVPRLMPAWRARVPAGGGKPNWVDGLASESFIWGFALGSVGFAASLKPAVLWCLAALGFAARFAHDSYIKGRARSGRSASE